MSSIKIDKNTIVYKGCSFLRQRLVLSLLSGKSVRIIQIRETEGNPGIQESEVSFIRLLDKLSNGTVIKLNDTGTTVYFQPGILYGGKVQHTCSNERGIGYYLEALLILGLFCKLPLHVTLHGVTSNEIDPSVDHVKMSMISTIKKFILEDPDIKITILKRGMPPEGGGEVIFECPVRKQLRPVQLSAYGMIKRIRGVAYALRVSPSIANRLVEAAKGVFLKFLPDVWITTHTCKGKAAGASPGFGIHLYAETTNGFIYGAECVSKCLAPGEDPSVPEDVGIAAAHRLLEEIYMGGCADSTSQVLAISCMALGPKDVSTFILGPLSEYSISYLQHLKEFFGITFSLERVESEFEDTNQHTEKIKLTCVGVGYSNISKPIL